MEVLLNCQLVCMSDKTYNYIGILSRFWPHDIEDAQWFHQTEDGIMVLLKSIKYI